MRVRRPALGSARIRLPGSARRIRRNLARHLRPTRIGHGVRAIEDLALVDELAALRLQHPQATLLAGSTDIGLWVNKQFRDLGEIIYLGEVAELGPSEALFEAPRHPYTRALLAAAASLPLMAAALLSDGPLRLLNAPDLARRARDAGVRMIVVHELAHLKESEHNKAFYQLCQHMEPDYHQLEFDLRLWLTWRDIERTAR